MAGLYRRDNPMRRLWSRCSPLWAYTDPGPDGSGLYLPAVRTVVYTVQDSGHRWRQNEWRRVRVSQIMERLGFTDWQFYWGARSVPYWRAIPFGHAELLRKFDPPLLILEDDIEPRRFVANVKIDERCELAYLGGFRSGDSRGLAAASAAGLSFKRAFRYGYQDVDADWMRVFGMWGTHAILHLNRRVMLELADLWEQSGLAVDTVTAWNQWRWQVHCRRVPMFWQNDGHHLRNTFSYTKETGPMVGPGV